MLKKMKSFMDNSIVEHNSTPPLRWIANWAGSRASSAVMRAAWLDEDRIDKGIRHTINATIYRLLWPIYSKYGTFYKIDMDLSGEAWDDYDENGVPYWDFVEKNTDDAFRVIKSKGIN